MVACLGVEERGVGRVMVTCVWAARSNAESGDFLAAQAPAVVSECVTSSNCVLPSHAFHA
jgi:hypothetical protein